MCKNLLTLVLFAFCICTLHSQSRSSDFTKFRDMRASSAEYQFKEMGYKLAGVEKSSSSIIQYWYNDRRRSCVAATINDGKVRFVVETKNQNCYDRMNGSSDRHDNRYNDRSNNRNDRVNNLDDIKGMLDWKAYNALDRMGYDRQHNFHDDGRDYTVWYNSRLKKCIKTWESGGYIKGVAGSNECNNVNHVKGWDRYKAYRELENMGYREQRGFRDDGRDYKVWYNYRARKCIKTWESNGKIAGVAGSNRCD